MRTIKDVEAEMGITILPWQREAIEAWREGRDLILARGRQSGRSTLVEFARRMRES